MSNILSEYYRTPLVSAAVCPRESRQNGAGFFRFGADVVCYGECASGVAADVQASADFDASKAMVIANSEIRLPFDISKIIDNLRVERYVGQSSSGRKGFTRHALIRPANVRFHCAAVRSIIDLDQGGANGNHCCECSILAKNAAVHFQRLRPCW